MKSEMPFHGVTGTAAQGRAAAVPARPTPRTIEPRTRRRCWSCGTAPPTARSGTPPSRSPVTGGARPGSTRTHSSLHRHLVVTGAWWDLVDEIAATWSARCWPATGRPPPPVMRAWAMDDDLWVRRTAVLCQLRHRADTDIDLLRYGDRGQRRRHQLLAPQGDRLGPPRVRQDRSRLGAGRGRAAGGAPERAQPAGGAQVPLTRLRRSCGGRWPWRGRTRRRGCRGTRRARSRCRC